MDHRELVPARALDRVGQVFGDALSRVKSGDPVSATLEWCVKELNDVDAKYQFIETDERSELIQALLDLPEVAGVAANAEECLVVIEKTRNW